MFVWLVLLLLIIAEVVAFRWWLRKEYYPVMFNGWAALIYTAILAADLIITWLVSTLLTPGGSAGAALLAIIGSAFVVIVALGTLFFRWVVKLDMTDISQK